MSKDSSYQIITERTKKDYRKGSWNTSKPTKRRK